MGISAQPAVAVSDRTEWDQQGDLPFQMHYSQLPDGAPAFSYDVPLGRISDMGAVFYPAGGASVMCGITPGADAP